jgi:hypothetical protein
VLVAALAFSALSARPVAAQSVESDAVKEKLSTRVHLRLGKTTLDKVAVALSEQTGLKIEPADYLLDREMIAQMDGISARAVLNALSELNDWKWKETPDHTISIARHLLQMPQVPVSIPRIVQSAIPKDTRAFLQIPTPSDNPGVYTNPLLANVHALANDRVTKGLRYLRDTQGELFSSLPADAVKGEPILFDKLTELQQHDLIVQIAFKQLTLLDEYLLSDFLPFVSDPQSARLESRGNTFMVGIHIAADKWSGFTARIDP